MTAGPDANDRGHQLVALFYCGRPASVSKTAWHTENSLVSLRKVGLGESLKSLRNFAMVRRI
jgi:hypothetical protein